MPLVPIRVDLGVAERRRASRHIILDDFGLDAQARLAGARVVVVGAGGLGSPVLQYLGAAGVGTVGIVDDDVVSPSNLQRQVLHDAAAVGEPKTRSAAAALQRLRPQVHVVEHALRLTAHNADAVLAGYDLVVDACDTYATRYVIGEAAARRGLPVVWGTVLGWDGLVSVWWADAPGGGLTYPEVFGEQPAEGATCDTAGVLGPACGVVGSTMAVEAIKLLTGTGVPALGRLLTYDARTSAWETIDLRIGAQLPQQVSGRATVGDVPGDAHPERRAPLLDGRGEPRDGTGHATGQTSGQTTGQTTGHTAGQTAGHTTGQTIKPEPYTLIIDVGLAPRDRPGEVWARFEDLVEGTLPEALLAHPVDAPVIVVCEYGLRARGAAGVLRAEGWAQVHAVSRAELGQGSGGIAPTRP